MQWFSGKRHAGKLARVVWEGGNGKGLEGTSPVPYFIWSRGKVQALPIATMTPHINETPRLLVLSSGKVCYYPFYYI